MNVIKAIVNDMNVSFPIGIVVSQFNQAVTGSLKDGAIQRLLELGFKSSDITLVEVPGAVEIPFIAQELARKKQVEAIIALGAVIRGETSHYDYVCEQVSQGCQRVMLDYRMPVIFGVLTTENDEQALARAGGEHSHKGRESADCAVIMHSLKLQIEQ